jgi:hypothetical protein
VLERELAQERATAKQQAVGALAYGAPGLAPVGLGRRPSFTLVAASCACAYPGTF